MSDTYKMKPRYDEEKIKRITTVRPRRGVILTAKRAIQAMRRWIPERIRDDLDKMRKQGISNFFRGLLVAEFLIGNDRDRGVPPEQSPTPRPDFRDRIRAHGGPPPEHHHEGAHFRRDDGRIF